MKNIKLTEADLLFSVVEETIRSGGSIKIKVAGYSMYPLVMSRRDSVLLTKADKIKKGDVPLIKRSDGTYVLHRVVDIKNGMLELCGDYETKREYPINPDQVIAIAKGFYRKEKFISCDSIMYKLYTFFWMNTMAMRPAILKIMGKSADIKDKMTS